MECFQAKRVDRTEEVRTALSSMEGQIEIICQQLVSDKKFTAEALRFWLSSLATPTHEAILLDTLWLNTSKEAGGEAGGLKPTHLLTGVSYYIPFGQTQAMGQATSIVHHQQAATEHSVSSNDETDHQGESSNPKTSGKSPMELSRPSASTE